MRDAREIGAELSLGSVVDRLGKIGKRKRLEVSAGSQTRTPHHQRYSQELLEHCVTVLEVTVIEELALVAFAGLEREVDAL